MEIPWGEASQVGGISFGTVFLLLVILAVIIWLGGVVINRINSRKGETDSEKKGD